MNHRTANGRLWLLSGWRAWLVSFGAVFAAIGIMWSTFTLIYPKTPWGFDDRLTRDEERLARQEEQAAKALKSDARFKQLAAVILTQPNSRDTPEVADAKRRMRRMFVIDTENGYEERGR